MNTSLLIHSVHLPVVELTLAGQTHVPVHDVLLLKALAVED